MMSALSVRPYRQIHFCRRIQQAAVIVKAGTVAGAVPGLFIRIPGQLTTHVRTIRGNHMELPGQIFINTGFLAIIVYDATLSRRQLVDTL